MANPQACEDSGPATEHLCGDPGHRQEREDWLSGAQSGNHTVIPVQKPISAGVK